jgi:hypothetical protein
MSIISNAITAPADMGEYTVSAERIIDQVRVFEQIAAEDDACRDELDPSRIEYAHWLEGRASAYRHAAKALRRTVDLFAHKDI